MNNRKRFPRSFAASTMLLTTLSAGCGGETPDDASQTQPIDAAVNQVSVFSGDGTKLDVHTTLDPSKQLSPDGIDATTDLDAPLADDARFFAPPNIDAPTQQVMKSDQGHAPVRLLGFVGEESSEADSRKAILKIGKKMVTMAQGDSVEGIELLSIQGRSITMQRDRDRWTLSLFDQPLVNQPQTRQPPHAAKRRQSRSSQRDSRPQPRPSTVQLPSLPAHGSETHADSNPIVEMPDLPAPPDLSELPGLEGLPGL